MARSFQIWSVTPKWCTYTLENCEWTRGNTYGYLLFFMERSSTKQILPRSRKVWCGGAVLNGEFCRAAGWVWRSCIAVVRRLHSLVGFVRSSQSTVYAEQTEICNHPIPSLPRCDAIFEGIDRLLVTWIALTTWSWTMVVHQGSQTGRARTRTTSTPVERNLT